MSALIGIYFGTVTAGGTDGTRASEGTGATPITIGPLDTATNEESSAVKLAIRCDSGYAATGATITPTGTTATKWALAPDDAGSAGTFGAYGAALSVGAVSDANTLVWAKTKAASAETPTNDTSVDLVIAATISPE